MHGDVNQCKRSSDYVTNCSSNTYLLTSAHLLHHSGSTADKERLLMVVICPANDWLPKPYVFDHGGLARRSDPVFRTIMFSGTCSSIRTILGVLGRFSDTSHTKGDEWWICQPNLDEKWQHNECMEMSTNANALEVTQQIAAATHTSLPPLTCFTTAAQPLRKCDC